MAKKKEWQRLIRETAHADNKKKEKQHNADHIQRARQMIFEGTGYGKQLIRFANEYVELRAVDTPTTAERKSYFNSSQSVFKAHPPLNDFVHFSPTSHLLNYLILVGTGTYLFLFFFFFFFK